MWPKSHLSMVAWKQSSFQIAAAPHVAGFAASVPSTGTHGQYAGSGTSRCGEAVYLLCAPRLVNCKHCGSIYVEALPWSTGKQRFTEALMVTLATWARVLTAASCVSSSLRLEHGGDSGR